MATVYLAIQDIFEREVALKVMAKGLADDPAFGQRFFREARIVSKLVHPNIVTVYDVGLHEGSYYLSMEYIDGEDLKHARHRLTPQQRIQVVQDIARALEFAGAKGYVHRDIKPENVMLYAQNNRAVLMDFGIARAGASDVSVTQTGIAIGTPHYMSPEQAKGQVVDTRSDLYSLGVMFYLLLTGRVPFEGDSAVSIGIKHIVDPVPLLPEALSAAQPIIDALMAKDPAHRYQSASLLVEALETLKSQAFWWPEVVTGEQDSVFSPVPLVGSAQQETQLSGAISDEQIGRFTLSFDAFAEGRKSYAPWLALGVVLGVSAVVFGYLHFVQPTTERPFAQLAQQPSTPAPGAGVGVDTATRLAQAAGYVKQGRLYHPLHDSAYSLYQQVLTAEPTHALARKGQLALPLELDKRAREWVAQGQYLVARQQVLAANQQRLGDKGLQLLQQQIDAAIAEHQRRSHPAIMDLRAAGQPMEQLPETQPEQIVVGSKLFVHFRIGAGTPPQRLQLRLYQGARGRRVATLITTAVEGNVDLGIDPPVGGFSPGSYVLDIVSGAQIVESVYFTLRPAAP